MIKPNYKVLDTLNPEQLNEFEKIVSVLGNTLEAQKRTLKQWRNTIIALPIFFLVGVYIGYVVTLL